MSVFTKDVRRRPVRRKTRHRCGTEVGLSQF